MASDWALSKAADYLVGDNLPSGCEEPIRLLANLLDQVKDAWLEEAALRAERDGALTPTELRRMKTLPPSEDE